MTTPLSSVGTHYLDVMKTRLQQDKQRSYECLALAPGASILEVGCGPATDTIALAILMGAEGHVTGIDSDPAMVDEAHVRVQAAELSDRVTHLVGDANDLPFPDNTFDGVRSERLFQHLPNAAGALDEMVRVTKHGGRIVVFDMDWGNLSVDFPEGDIERRLTRFKVDHMHANGHAGRQLYRLFREATLLDVQVEPRNVPIHDVALFRLVTRFDKVEANALEAGVVTLDELERWRSGLASQDASGTFFACGTMMLASGTKA